MAEENQGLKSEEERLIMTEPNRNGVITIEGDSATMTFKR